MHHMTTLLFLYLCFLFYLLSYFHNVGVAGAGENPLTPTAFMKRYWKKQICNDLPIPGFLLKKASPLTAVEFATFSKLASTNQTALSASLPRFCYSANLFCCPNGECEKPIGKNVSFAVYADDGKKFTNYGAKNFSGSDSFSVYSRGRNVPNDSFVQYSSHSVDHGDNFTQYATNGNDVHQDFGKYGTAAAGGAGNFNLYEVTTNVDNVQFTTYSSDAQGRQQQFVSYSRNSNVGNLSFTSYGKRGDGAVNGFQSYGKTSNVMLSTFNGYGKEANRAKNSFSSYGSTDSNVPSNDFKNYGHGGKGEVDSFTEYRNDSNVGEDSFKAYGQGSKADKVTFVNYGKSVHIGSDNFTGYGKGAKDESVGFTSYGVNNTFKEYAKTGGTVSFSQYVNETSPASKLSTGNSSSMGMMMMMMSEKVVNGFVEPGKFFRESMLTTGTIMPMPDICDKMPKRSFLSRGISSKLPFSTLTLPEMRRIFWAGENSSMASILGSAVGECERAPSAGETKRCVGSIEDMIDFVISVLGHNVMVQTTENTNGSNTYVMIGKVIGINGGNVTTSVSCHQSLFPYLLYYCHSVPKVRVYEADILDPKTKAKINHGVAICHLDTSSWSAGHGAFLALGSGPGEIEVCHWIFENDMTWTTAD
ncbi:hypothetical protein Vadar_008373 [Vaccinium darrowii]|uniref:Uncharacterized protein n=1 Tax=Vaccinium darrowii TaxID=229202 RepID=A0ACB7YU66_9ERIC|nr:hypothetical protein Vadar_008373 [Vaccinium darrowii]